MNVRNGSQVIKEAGVLNAVSVSMVGNPPQTLPPELRGDGPLSQKTTTATATDCKLSNFSSEDCSLNFHPEESPCPQQEDALLLGPASLNIAPLQKNIEVSNPSVEVSSVFPTQQWSCNKKSQLNSNHGCVTQSKRTNPQAQSIISLPVGFQCSSLFKPGQPVAFLPSTNFSPPLCKITLPPCLSQIAALREPTASQLHVECQPQMSSSGVTPNLQTNPYHFSVVKAPVSKAGLPSTAVHKSKHGPVSSYKNSNSGAGHGSPLHSVASPIVARPLKHPASGPSQQSPVSVSSSTSPTHLSTHGRVMTYLEKSQSHQGVDKMPTMYSGLKPQSDAVYEHTVTEVRDVPLDLSSKSKRLKVTQAPEESSLGTECHHTEEAEGGCPIPPKKAVPATFGPRDPLSIFPEGLRNGAPSKQASQVLNRPAHKPSMSWAKSSHSSTSNLSGTYVGVASPILASTLCSSDGKGAAFVEDLQSNAKQVTISIIDQGEQSISKDVKGSSIMKDIRHTFGSGHSNTDCLRRTLASTTTTTTTTTTCTGSIATVLSNPAGSSSHCKVSYGRTLVPLSPTIDSAACHLPVSLPYQGSPIKQKVIQVTPNLRVTTGCKSPLLQSSHSIPPKIVEKKLGKTKSPLSKLESIVKQKALETSALGGEGCCNAESAGQQPEAMSLSFRSQDTPSSGFQSSRLLKKREGKIKKVLSEQLAAKISDRQKNGSIAEPVHRTTKKCVEQVAYLGSVESSNKSELVAQPQILDGQIEKNNFKSEFQRTEEMPEIVSSCIKMEGMALSILKSPNVVELEKELCVIGEAPPSKGEVMVDKCKMMNWNKDGKSSLVSSKKIARCLKRSREKEGSASEGPRRRKKKQGASVLQSGQVDEAATQLPEEQEKVGSGCSNLIDVVHTPHIKAGNESSSGVNDPAFQGSPDWLNKEVLPVLSCPPKQKRGRRPAEKKLSASKVCPPPPETQIRRKRGRPRSNPPRDQEGLSVAKRAPTGGDRDASSRKKRKRRRNRKYQNGEYITERDKAGDEGGNCVATRQATRAGTDQRVGSYPRLSATLACRGASPDRTPKRALHTRSGSMHDSKRPASPEPEDKPSGKRKFKSKHLCDTEERKFKTKRGSSGKCSAPLVSKSDSSPVKKPPDVPSSPCGKPSPPTGRRGSIGRGRMSESPPGRPIPPEVRRLIVNKNAGETLLQRAARLGYQEVVLYCLEKDEREVNRQDNAGYTALHEACSRGWTQIVKVLLEHGADVNCSAQDGTRPIHDAVASDNLPAVWMLLNRGADPTLATYSGQTAVKLAQSNSMKIFLREYFADLDGGNGQDPSAPWDFYSSAVFEAGQEACWDFLLLFPDEEEGRKKGARTEDCFTFEFSSEPLLPCYRLQVSLSHGFCNWFLLSDVLKRLKMSARIFQARYPHLEVASLSWVELRRQVSASQVTPLPKGCRAGEEEEADGQVELVRCVLELQELLGSSVHFLEVESSDILGPPGSQSPPACQICPRADSKSHSPKSKKSNKWEER